MNQEDAIKIFESVISDLTDATSALNTLVKAEVISYNDMRDIETEVESAIDEVEGWITFITEDDYGPCSGCQTWLDGSYEGNLCWRCNQSLCLHSFPEPEPNYIGFVFCQKCRKRKNVTKAYWEDAL